MDKLDAHKELSKLGKGLDRLGVFSSQEDGRTVGNLSVKTRRGIWLTISGSDKAKLQPDDVIEVTKDGAPLSSGVPSRELYIHTAVQADPATSVVAHIHDQLVLQFPDPNDPRVNFLVGASREEGEAIGRAMVKSPYLQIDGHGQVIKGPTSQAVLDLATNRHRAARNRWHKAMTPTYALAASFLLAVGGIIKSDQDRFGDCQVEHRTLGTVTYTCPTDRGEVNLKSWEGEQRDENTDGSTSYTFWVGGQ